MGVVSPLTYNRRSYGKLETTENTMNTLDDMVDVFELLGDWEQRYQYLIELGEQLPPMPLTLQTDNNKVKGCMSQVWVHAYRDHGAIRFQGDCDTSVIKGILALLIMLCEGKPESAIREIDMDQLFARLGLDEHLSPNRHVGVYAIYELIKQKAIAAVETVQAPLGEVQKFESLKV